MEKIVITGANGFVGKHLSAELTSANYEVTGWDLPAVDITRPETYTTLLQELQPNWVAHLAGLAAVGTSEEQVEEVMRVNTGGTRLLLETIAQASPATKVLAISSADIYNQPRNAYARSKWAMEELIEADFNNRCIRVRPFPHIGPGQGLGFVTADFASQIAAIEAGRQEPVINVGNLTTERDFTDVRDVVRAYRLLIERGELGEVYDIASGRVVSIRELLDQLLALSSVKIAVAEDPTRLRSNNAPMPVGDASKLRALGWQPKIPLEQTLKDILTWWRERN